MSHTNAEESYPGLSTLHLIIFTVTKVFGKGLQSNAKTKKAKTFPNVLPLNANVISDKNTTPFNWPVIFPTLN